jgi:hypothetical protein
MYTYKGHTIQLYTLYVSSPLSEYIYTPCIYVCRFIKHTQYRSHTTNTWAWRDRGPLRTREVRYYRRTRYVTTYIPMYVVIQELDRARIHTLLSFTATHFIIWFVEMAFPARKVLPAFIKRKVVFFSQVFNMFHILIQTFQHFFSADFGGHTKANF